MMEKPQIGTLKPSVETPLSFHRPRRSHLKSETYRTLVRILSHCHDESQLCNATQIVNKELKPDNDCIEPGLATEKEMCDRSELVSRDSAEPVNLLAQKGTVVEEGFEAVCLQNRGFSDTQMVVDEVDHIMRIEEEELLSQQNDLMVCDSSEGTGSQYVELCRVQMLIDESKNLTRGNEELVEDSSINLSATPLDDNQSGGGVVALINNQEEYFDLQQIVMEESESATPVEADKEHCSQKIPEAFDLPLDRSMTSKASKTTENMEEKSSSLKTNTMEVKHEMQQKEMELEKSVCTRSTMDYTNHMIEEGEIEEGEISGNFEANDYTVDMFPENVVVLKDKKVDEKQVSEGLIDKNEFTFNEQRSNERYHESTSFIVDVVCNNANSGGEAEFKESVRNEMACKYENAANEAARYTCVPAAGRNKKGSGPVDGVCCPAACPNNPVLHGEIIEQTASGNQQITSKERQDAGACNKKKRGTPSKESKAKKKEKGRKKRAQKNRQLGVKRLKLQPILKPKTVTYCRHFLKGRCHEGDQCKFSHDMVPLTKSKPCCHFARNSCMKGDDCPFDHQLSKYPCSNYVAKGFCSRGGDCMFSHKMPLKEDAQCPSNASKPELKPSPLLADLNSKKQLNINGPSHRNVNALACSVGAFSCKGREQNVVEYVLEPPALAPKGISCLSFGKSSAVESSKLNHDSSSSKRNESGKVRSQTDQSATGTVQRTPPAAAPKGINFLSFGKSPLEDSSSKKLVSLPLDREDASKLSLLNNFTAHKQPSSSPNGDDGVKLGNQTTSSMSFTIQNPNDRLKKTQPAVAPQGMNFLSFRKAVIDDSGSNEKANLPSSSDNGISRSVQESQNADKHHSSSAITLGLPASPLALGQSEGHLVRGQYKNTPSSAQKALISTLAFAAKFESEMKIKGSTISALAASSKVNEETRDNSIRGDSQNDSAKASKILEFLSGFSSKTK